MRLLVILLGVCLSSCAGTATPLCPPFPEMVAHESLDVYMHRVIVQYNECAKRHDGPNATAS
jgi:hypothetical protein